MQPKMDESTTSKQYDRWSGFYDQTFGRLVIPRLRRAIEELRPKPGETVLDVGIGTGVTLDLYPEGVRVVGLDLSAGMLQQAQAKVRQRGLKDVSLVAGDALRPPFAEHRFDHLLLTHVVSVVSDPPELLRWAARLVKPGGRVAVVNHFQSEIRPLAAIEKALNPLCTRIGWRTDVGLADVVRPSPLRLEYQFKLRRLDPWRIVMLNSEPVEEESDHESAPSTDSPDRTP